ncbi:unnamed protein product, partial [Ectocarpus sp. 8 AP-2014]
GAANVATNELRATASPATATLSEADDDDHHNTKPKTTVHAGETAAGAKEDGAAGDDAPLPGELFAQKDPPISRTTPLAAAPLSSSPPARENSQGRTADRPRVGAGGDHDVGGLASVDGKGTTCCTTTATYNKKSSCSVRNHKDNMCPRGSSSAGSSERRKSRRGNSSATGRKTKDLAGGDGGLTPDIFAQFMYSPPSSR